MSYTEALPSEAIRAHDLAREVPEAMWTSVIDELLQRRGSPGPPATSTSVDIGIGTGAVGGRLAERGVDVVGVDCNASMLAALSAAHPSIPVVVGDACDVPLADGSSSLTVMACVLHLVYDWQRALEEAVRLTAPGGAFAVNIGQSGLDGRTGISRYFLEVLTSTVELPPMPGPADPADVATFLASIGLEPVEPVRVTGTTPRSTADHIHRLEWNPFAWPPGTPQDALAAAAVATRRWAEERFGDLDVRSETTVAIGFTTFRKR